MEAKQCRVRLLGLSCGNNKQKGERQPPVGAGAAGYHLDRLQSSGRTGNARCTPVSSAFSAQFQQHDIPGHRTAHDDSGIQCRQPICRCHRAGQRSKQGRKNQLCTLPPAKIIRLAYARCEGPSAQAVAECALRWCMQAFESDNPVGVRLCQSLGWNEGHCNWRTFNEGRPPVPHESFFQDQNTPIKNTLRAFAV